jgi:RNA dependent RNA polymerase
MILPDNSIELIADILDGNGGPMTDGCGLMSRDALNEVWKHYSGASTLCPYSSFQGRIGGFKGMWVLDDSLDGMQIQCRTSQLKFNLPMKSLITTSEYGPLLNDPLYDTVELNSWDEKPEKGFLVSFLPLFTFHGARAALTSEHTSLSDSCRYLRAEVSSWTFFSLQLTMDLPG